MLLEISTGIKPAVFFVLDGIPSTVVDEGWREGIHRQSAPEPEPNATANAKIRHVLQHQKCNDKYIMFH